MEVENHLEVIGCQEKSIRKPEEKIKDLSDPYVDHKVKDLDQWKRRS